MYLIMILLEYIPAFLLLSSHISKIISKPKISPPTETHTEGNTRHTPKDPSKMRHRGPSQVFPTHPSQEL